MILTWNKYSTYQFIKARFTDEITNRPSHICENLFNYNYNLEFWWV